MILLNYKIIRQGEEQMYFFGKYNHQMDAKGRLRIPCKLKSTLGSDFIVSRGVGGCLFIFAPDKIEEIQRKLASIPFGDKQNQKTARTFFASIDQPEEDNQGRFILDPSLRKFADIKKGVVFVGVGNRIELWSEERWNEYNNLDNPEAFDEAFVDLEKYGV